MPTSKSVAEYEDDQLDCTRKMQWVLTAQLLLAALEEDIEAVKEKVDDPVMCEKVRLYVYAPREIQAVYKADACESIRLHATAIDLTHTHR